MTEKNAPGAEQGTEGVDNQNSEKAPVVNTIIADTTADTEEWVDIRHVMPQGGLITPDAVAAAIEERSGRSLIRRIPDPGRGPKILLHPDLERAVRAWYALLPASLDGITSELVEVGAAPAETERIDATAEASELARDAAHPRHWVSLASTGGRFDSVATAWRVWIRQRESLEPVAAFDVVETEPTTLEDIERALLAHGWSVASDWQLGSDHGWVAWLQAVEL